MRTRILTSLAMITVTALLAGCGNTSQPAAQLPAPRALQTTETTPAKIQVADRWMVEFASPSGIQQQSITPQGFSKLAQAEGISYTQNYTYSRVFNGISITTSSANIRKIAAMPGVKAVHPVFAYTIPNDKFVDPVSPEMATAISQTGADIAQNELGLTGKGIRVGIIDSGVDVDHPDLKGRIVAQKDFVGDDYNATRSNPKYNPVPKPDPVADDCDGHGTHVAGIVGANGTIKGVAPEVSFGAYRVFGCDGGVYDDIMIAALDQAVMDKMDIVNMSIGSFASFPTDMTSEAIKRASEQGTIVVASAGNEGAQGPFATGGIGGTPEAIAVSSFENTAVMSKWFKVGNLDVQFNWSDTGGAMPTSGTLEFARTGTPASTADACVALPANSLKGKAALIRRGGCTFYEKAKNAQAAGAAAVIIYNNAAGAISPTVAGDPPITIPTGAISKADGEAIDALIAGGGTVTLQWQATEKRFANPRAGLMSDFTSYGPGQFLTFKPDVGAPGGGIYSTYPLEKGGFATVSGTSMSAPHVAGAIALMLQARPDLKGNTEKVRALLQNNAVPTLFPGAPILDSVNRQGAGMINVVNSIQNPAMVVPGNLALGEVEGTVTKTVRVYNNGTTPVTYTLTHAPAVGTYESAPNQLSGESANLETNFSKITVNPGQSFAFKVDITPSEDDYNGTVFGGYLVMTPDKGMPIRVPYMGFKGDYQTEPAMTKNYLAWFDPAKGEFYAQFDGAEFDLSKGEFPTALAHFDFGVEKVVVDILDGRTEKPLYAKGSVYSEDNYIPRNPLNSEFWDFTWDASLKKAQLNSGVPVTKTVPNGAYRMRLKALRAGGNPNSPQDWDVWVSPLFYIKN